MIAARRLAAALILAALVLVIGLDVLRPGPSGADEHLTQGAQTESSTTTAQASDTTAAPTTTAAPASTTTAPATATTTAPATTVAPTTTTDPAASTTVAPATTAPATTVAPTTTAPAAAGSTTTTAAPATGSTRTTARPAPTTVAEPTGAARRQAPAPPQGESVSMPDLGALLEDQPREAAEAERGGLAAKPLAAGGIAAGAVVGLLLGLADRAAGLARR